MRKKYRHGKCLMFTKRNNWYANSVITNNLLNRRESRLFNTHFDLMVLRILKIYLKIKNKCGGFCRCISIPYILTLSHELINVFVWRFIKQLISDEMLKSTIQITFYEEERISRLIYGQWIIPFVKSPVGNKIYLSCETFHFAKSPDYRFAVFHPFSTIHYILDHVL